ncbi:MAG: hypothetical protein JNN26_17145 [Candidatus Obscuribacter sp.]|nr:hypothetical protein [Candidatus Obscuribacter sp.]
MRWRFADSKNKVEMQFKQQSIDKMDTFWRDFEENLDLICSTNTDASTAWISSNLAEVADLFWELSPEINGYRRFAITPEKEYHLHPLVDEMIARAPRLSNFKFMSYRAPMENTAVETAVPARFKATTSTLRGAGRIKEFLADIQIKATRSNLNCIDLQFVSEAFKGENNFVDQCYCFILCEVVLGQRIAEEWIGEITTTGKSLPLVDRAKALFQKRQLDSSIDFYPVTMLSSCVKAVYEDILASRDFVAAEIRPSVEMQHLALPKPRIRRDFVETLWPAIIVAAHNKPLCFTSERFSSTGESFCYVIVDLSSVPVDSLDTAEVYRVFDKALVCASVGYLLGYGLGPEHLFLDMLLTDIDAAVPVLQEVCHKLELPPECWLKFVDSKWRNEWIGLHTESPEPEPTPDW